MGTEWQHYVAKVLVMDMGKQVQGKFAKHLWATDYKTNFWPAIVNIPLETSEYCAAEAHTEERELLNRGSAQKQFCVLTNYILLLLSQNPE